MYLPSLEQNRKALVSELGKGLNLNQLRSVGIWPGATVEVLNKTPSRGCLLKVGDTRLVMSFELAQKIKCAYK